MTHATPMPTVPSEAEPVGSDPLPCRGEALPSIRTSLTEAEVLSRLGLASRRGRLPGFIARPSSDVLFRVSAFGHPVDGRLDAGIEGSGADRRITFQLTLPRRLRVILALILLLTVWPGLYFMDQLMIQFLSSARAFVPTWWWYLPVTVAPIPWVWRSVMNRARHTTAASANEAIRKIAFELGAAAATR
jgi:hypothetical protein